PSSPAPSLPTTPGEEGEKQEEEILFCFAFFPSPGEGGREGEGEKQKVLSLVSLLSFSSLFSPSPGEGGREGVGRGGQGVRVRAGGIYLPPEGFFSTGFSTGFGRGVNTSRTSFHGPCGCCFFQIRK